MAEKWKVRYKVLEESYANFREQHSCRVVKWRRENLQREWLREGEMIPIESIEIPEELVYRDRKYRLIE